MATIDELLNLLQEDNSEIKDGKLPNTRETWSRIGNKDSFDELDLSGSALDEFLSDWVSNNPYSSLT